MTEYFAQPDDLGEIRASEVQTGLGGMLGAQASEAFGSGTRALHRVFEYGEAGGALPPVEAPYLGELTQSQAPVPEVPIADAQKRVEQAGLKDKVKLPAQVTIRQPVLDLMLAHGHERADYEAAVGRGPQGFLPDALGFITQVGAGMIDPVNAAAFSIPVLGEARYGALIARAGESIAARAGVRAGVGIAQGAAGGTALVPGEWWLHTLDGQDYTYADALRSVVLSAGMGGAFHAGFGALGDLRARARGVPLPGSPADLLARKLMEGTHVPGPALADEGVPAGEMPGISPEDIEAPPAPGEPLRPYDEATEGPPPPHPAEVLADLPPAVREDLVHAAAADMIDGRPVRAGEMLQEAAREDPRIAESLGVEAFHGTPYDFERFDIGKVGAGEGAQSYGHGLYFAENRAVAEDYAKNVRGGGEDFRDEAYNDPDLGPRLREADREERAAYSKFVDATNSGDERVIAKARAEQEQAFHFLESVEADAARKYPAIGNIYKVRIAADKERFLDWDKPLKDQPDLLEKFRQIVSPDIRAAFDANVEHGISGANAYHNYVGGGRGGAAASNALREAGIPGIKYLDQGSRAPFVDIKQIERGLAEMRQAIARVAKEIADNKDNPNLLPQFFRARVSELRELRASEARALQSIEDITAGKDQTYNFVVFDDKLIRITHKNGKEVGFDEMKAERAAAAASQQAAASGATVLPGPPSARGPRARPEETYSLLEWLAHRGGLADNGEVRTIFGGKNPFIPGFGKIIRRTGMSLDEALQAAKDGKYLIDAAELEGREAGLGHRELLDLIDREARGEKQYRVGEQGPERAGDRDEYLHRLDSDFDAALKEVDVEPPSIDTKLRARAIEIMDKEREKDPLVAFERAWTEEVQRAADEGRIERTAESIPGWDVPAEPGAGAGAGGRPESLGRPGAGEAGGAGRPAGAGDRAAATGNRADFARFADRPEPDPDLVEASRQADKAPEPESAAAPEKALSAAERAAAEADELLDDIRSKLSDEEKRLFDEALESVARDSEERKEIARQSAACLLEAVA